MPAKRFYQKYELPPNPDSLRYQLVTTRKGSYYRKIRTVNTMNASMQQQSMLMELLSPAGKRIRDALRPWIGHLQTGDLPAEIYGRLAQHYKLHTSIGFESMVGLEMQAAHWLGKILQVPVHARQEHGFVRVRIQTDAGAVKQLNQLVTEYFFEAILLYGDAGIDAGLKTAQEQSELLVFGEPNKKEILFEFALPQEPWMLLLKLSCFEGEQRASHPRHYGMRVLAAG